MSKKGFLKKFFLIRFFLKFEPWMKTFCEIKNFVIFKLQELDFSFRFTKYFKFLYLCCVSKRRVNYEYICRGLENSEILADSPQVVFRQAAQAIR